MISIPQEHWRSRWLILPESDLLHRVDEIKWGTIDEQGNLEEDEEMIEGLGKTVCGLDGPMRMPGIFSRMSLQRCPECCNRLNIPQGKGNPYNEDIEE